MGVDIADAMLAQARQRVKDNSWLNVELIQSDAASYHFPANLDGIVSSVAITLVPEFDAVIQDGHRSLSPDGRFVVLDFKLPAGWLSNLARLGVLLTRPFGVSMELASRHPWESLAAHFGNVALTECYGGFAYVPVGELRDVKSIL